VRREGKGAEIVKKVRWGILGTGAIAKQFVQGLNSLPEAEVFAVGSRSEASAAKFAGKRNIPRRHASYDALASDPDVDVVYIATPTPSTRRTPRCASRPVRPCSARSPSA
jgi:predicted dehydrogenase